MLKALLERHLHAVLAATVLLFATGPSVASQIVLQGVTGNSCTYSTISVDAAGSMTVICSSGPLAGPAGTFSITSNGTTLPWNYVSTTTFTITRSNGSTGGVTVNFTRSGGCGPLPLQDTANFANGVTSVSVPVRTPNNSTTCQFTLTAVTATDNTASSPPMLGSGTVATVPVSSATVAGCPVASNAVPIQINPLGVDHLTLNSGTIGYMPLPTNVSSVLGAGVKAAKFNFSDATNSPTSGTREVWISHCPGSFDASVDTSLTDANPGRCYISDTDVGAQLSLNWFEAPGVIPAVTDSTANAYGICEAYATNGPWYVNVRWTYQDASCPWGIGQCGYVGQWGYSGFTP